MLREVLDHDCVQCGLEGLAMTSGLARRKTWLGTREAELQVFERK